MMGQEIKKTVVAVKETSANSYVVTKEDKFHEIATKNGISFAELKRLNGDSSKLEEGQILKLKD